jgi:hypothetical protein
MKLLQENQTLYYNWLLIFSDLNKTIFNAITNIKVDGK